MKKEQIARLLEHWRRPVPGSDLFRFSHVLLNIKTDETTPALYKSLFAAISHPNTTSDDPVLLQDQTPDQIDSPPQYPTPVLRLRAPTPDPIATRHQSPIIDPILLHPTPVNALPPNRAPTPALESRPSIPSPVGLTTEPNQPRPRPKPRPQKAAASTDDPSPNQNEQQEGLGRTKRVAKRRLDIYLAAEEKISELAKKKKQDKRKK
jgi:hypothetical protein